MHICYIYLNISGKGFSSSSLLPSVAKEYGLFLKDAMTCSLLSGASAFFTIAVVFVLKVKNNNVVTVDTISKKCKQIYFKII